MKRLTFGVNFSPFLATKVMHQITESSKDTHLEASRAILQSFYVDDYLHSVQEALRDQLIELLSASGI